MHPAHGAFVANLHCPRPRSAWPWAVRNAHGAADADARERASVWQPRAPSGAWRMCT